LRFERERERKRKRETTTTRFQRKKKNVLSLSSRLNVREKSTERKNAPDPRDLSRKRPPPREKGTKKKKESRTDKTARAGDANL